MGGGGGSHKICMGGSPFFGYLEKNTRPDNGAPPVQLEDGPVVT